MRITFIALLVASSHLSSVNAQKAPPQTGPDPVISGRVVDGGSGTGLPGVLVTVEGGGPSTHTDAAGSFQLAAVPAGRYKLFVSLVGYALARRDIDVPAAGVSVTIPLSEGTGGYSETVI